MSAERLGIIGHRETVARLGSHAEHARADGARRRRPVLQLVRHPHRRDLARSRRAATRPRRGCPRSTTAGSRSGCAWSRAACPSCARGRRRCSTRWTSASTTGPSATRSSSTTRRRPARRCAATTRPSPRAGSRPTSGSRRASSRAPVLRDVPRVPRQVHIRRDEAVRRRRAPTSARAVFEGALPYAGTRVTPSWGGSMFEALMPTLFVPEERWGAGELGRQPPALRCARRSTTGWPRRSTATGASRRPTSPRAATASTASTGSAWTPRQPVERGQDAGRPRLPGLPERPALPDPPPSAYTNGVVTPHAAFLALRYAPRDALANLRRLERDFPGLYGKWGFRDSVNVDTGLVSEYYLSLDQGMVMAALGNALGDDVLRRAFVTPRDRARAAAAARRRGVRRDAARGCTITGTPRADRLRGTRGDDVICGLGGDDRIDGRRRRRRDLRRRGRRPAGGRRRGRHPLRRRRRRRAVGRRRRRRGVRRARRGPAVRRGAEQGDRREQGG